MFWNDPNLYGASFPYRDINTPLQTPWMNFPRDVGAQQTPWMNFPRDVGALQTPFMNFPKDIGMLQSPFMNVPRDISTQQTPFVGGFAPWQSIPRFVPPVYGYTQPPFFGIPQVNPYIHGTTVNPFVQPNLGLPQANWCRPFTY